MKFIGKLFVITALLAGFNIQPLAYAAPSSSEDKVLNPSVPGKATTKANSVSKTPEKATHDKMVVTATAGNLQSQININSADAEELAQSLSGIGRKKAEAIVNYREQFGFFTDAEQLLEVPGIGPSFLERNRSKLRM
ncbi:TPA: ComEA family DNA-binding protein [Yersinia enterocolitica]|uniref:ComEA family DNA-binding protein n=1 Tax=Yersinia enterocolitica TaxID=630 RepID=UPI0005FCEF0C|nr:ComEA family DNA-binding protein [Yersinia enterocolitica]EKN5932554.1 helix-hairpin-helix domain-containing protein [Yersinia enterocolitica]ELX2274823.1 ComEA family DNA-binding protein [Yersinia enterocolitica]ELY5259012.1 ComEA family DNA-binding protein [Yersinia enterocolitica]CRE91984.1 competence protein ComEA [Yersinia enterocolitica]HDL6629008.1 ComEA family DNA-binding protein [Yersinia enterocolitica]